jgi:hypothetical protein
VSPSAIRRATAAFAFALVANGVLASAARADDTPTADALLERSKIATGADRRPDTESEAWTVRLAGLDGTFETVRRGSDSVTTMELGPFRTARGSWHGEKWHQNENGETIVDRAEPSQVEKVLTQTVTRVHEPVDAWELVTTYASGHVVRAYYDPHTYDLVRSEHVSAGHIVHTSYDDFRTDARGRVRAWHFFGGDERPDNDFDYRLIRDDEDAAIADADLTIPRDRRVLVEFPDGSDTVRLPARIVDGRIYVRVEIAGRGLDFLLDSGAGAITIDDTVARELKLPIYGRSTQTVAGSFPTGRVVVPAVAIGTLTMHDVVMHTLPYSAPEMKSVRVVGLLGYDFLADASLRIDYAAGTVDALRPGVLVAPPGAGALDVRLNSGTPVARATIGTATGDDFIIDTGAAFSYVIFQRFARLHRDELESQNAARVGSGVGGSFAYRPIDTTRVILGAWSLDDATGVEALAPNAFGFDNEDGLIGSDILKRFTVYLDYPDARVILEPNVRSGIEATNAKAER